MSNMGLLLRAIDEMANVEDLETLLNSIDELNELKRTVDYTLRSVRCKVSKIVGPEYGAYQLLTPNIRGIRSMLRRMK